MSDLGLEYYFVDHIATGLQTLAHNLREDAIGKALNSKGALDFKLSEIVE
jgi:hypothetical protein